MSTIYQLNFLCYYIVRFFLLLPSEFDERHTEKNVIESLSEFFFFFTWVYSISIIVGYLMLNSFLYK